MKLLFLTAITTIPTEEGQKRIEKAVKKNRNSDGGEDFAKPGTSAWFRQMNITPPSDLEEEDDEIDEQGFMQLPLEEIDYEFSDLVIPLKQISACEENPLIGSQLFTKSGEVFHIEETPEQLFQYITVITRPWYQKLLDWIKIKLKININK